MYKSKRQKNKSFDWYGLSQRFSIRKYHFGAASVLLGTALILGAAQTTAKAEETATENKTEAVASAPKDDKVSENVANVTTPALSATTEAAVVEKPTLSDEEVAKLAAEASKKDEKVAETATTEKTEAADKEKATLTAPSTDKKADKAVDEKADKKDEKKAENPITATKTVLEQLTSEAEVLNTTASNFADKKAEDKAGKEAIATAVASAKVQIEASKKALAAGEITKQELDAQLQRISSAIEAVYAEMKRAGHNGKIEGLLDGTATTTTGARNNPPKELTVIQNPMALDEEEVLTIIKNVRNANPGLTFDDEIIVSKTGANGNAGGVTIKYADGSPSVTFESGRVVTSTAGAKNLEQLSDSINWFDFATAKITYTDGSTASRVKYLDTPINKTLTAATGSTGRTFSGKFTMYREVTLGKDYVVDGFTYVKGTKINSTEDAFLKMGIAKYEQHLYHDGKTQNGGEIYEALQEGMRFNVPTKVEGYNLVATVAKLGPKDVKTNVGKDKGYTGNTLRYDTKHPTGQIIKDDKTGEVNNLSKIVNGPDGGGRGVDVLLTTINKDYSYLDKAGISTAHREFRDDDSDFKPTGEKREGLVAFTSSRDNSNFGVTLSVGATFNGVPVAVNAIVADGDESGNREFSQFETDGTNWSELMELHWDNRQVDANKRVVEAANGNLVVTDKNGNVYLDSKGNPIIINRTKQLQEEKVQEGANSYTRYYLTSADGYKVVVSEKNKALALDDSGNPYVYDKTGAVSTTTKEGMFKELSDGNRQLVDAEGRDIYLGFNHATAGLETIVLPAGVTNPEFVSDTPEDTRNGWKKTKLYGTVNGVRQEITKDAYGHSLVGSSGYLFEEWTPGNRDKGMVFEKLTKNPPRVANAGDIGDFSRYGYNPNEWATTSEVYGSKLFGSNITAFSSKNRLPIALSQDVKNLSFYGNSSSSVSGVIGFIIYDGGDAPASYGSAQHIIGNFNKTVNGREVTATQPFIGNQKADVDFRTSVNEPSGAWTLDDLVHSEKYHEMSIGAEAANDSERKRVINQKGEEGVFLITSSGNAVIRKDNGEQIAVKQGEILTAMDERTGTPVTGVYNHATRMLGLGSLPDEGLDQLVDPEALDDNGEKIGRKEYTLRQASDTEYVLYGVRANPGQFNEKAYLRGWVDFDGNGKFDSYEESELIEVTPDKKTYNIRFKNIPQLLDTSIDKVGIRLRIALPVKNDKGQEDKQLASPTGVEASGEVEDFQTHVIHYPRGTRHTTKDYQGVEQKIKIPTNAMFIANGKSRESNYQNWVQINNTSLSPKIVLTDKIVASEEAVADANLPELPSNYRKGADGTIFVEKNDVTVYSGKFVTVKDAKGNLLGTALKVVNPNNNKTEYLMTEYNEYDKVGNKVGTYKINPENKGANKLTDANYYETTVTFKPELGYVGTATGIAIRAWDDNNSSTGWEATPETIAASNNQPNLADKDRINGNVNENVNKAKSMDTVYIPTVIDIKPVGKDETTIDEQGKKQKASPKIPDHGTVESINNETIDGARIDKAHVLIDKSKPIEFSTVQAIPGKVYTEDTKVTEETVVTYEDGGTATFKPVDKLPAGTVVFDQNKAYTVTGTGNITVNKVNYGGGTVPKGAILTGSEPTAPIDITVNRNGSEVVVPKGEKLKKGDVLVTPLPVQGGTQRTEWTMTYHTGDTIPGKRTSTDVTLANEITIDQLLKDKGDSITFNGVTYTNNNDVIPKGTISHGAAVDLMNVKLPKATHVNPQTGEVTTVARRYTKVTANEIVIENEGTYTLVPKTTTNEKGETVYEDATVVFTPHPSFVGVGTGVTLRQPDVDYPTVADPDKVTRRYGTDYGYAKYTPTVTPNLTATITRKIHYVYEGDTSTAAKDKTPILTIDGKPVTNEQTLTYNRDYIVMSQDGQTEKDITVASAMTLESPITVVRKGDQVVKEATTVTKLKAGDVVKAGTQLPAGTVIVGAWKAINPENDHFTDIISPTLKGYTAEVQLPEGEYTKSEKNGVQSHVRSSNQTPVGVYTPTIKDGKVNTQDVGAYEPMVSAVRADNKDDFDVYVYYKADKQVARVVYIDMDAANNADQGVLETHTGSTLEANKSATDTITKDETLYGDSATRIKYSTAATIAKYEAMGYELKRDGFTNDDDGNRIVGGRKFDEESVADSVNAGEKAQNQTFYVFLGHKRDTGAKTERADVTRTINYKYKKDGSKAAESVTETLNFTRNITIDMALAAAAFPEDTATFNAENTKATPEEKQAAQAKYAEVEKQYNAAAEKVKEDSTTAQALATADKDVTTTEKALADAKKANNSLVITSESTQAQKDAKAVVEAALQAAQTAYDNALAARNTARTNYLAAANSDLAKAVITTQKALEAENAKVAAAKAEYEAKVKDNNASDADKNAALTKFTDAIALAKTAAVNATAAQKAFTDAKDEKEALNDAKVAEAVKNQAIQDRANTTQAAKEAARQAYYDAVIAKVKEESKKETPDKNKVAAVSFGEWKALGSSATNLPTNEQLSEAEKQSDNAFNHVTSPTITGYLADKVAIDKTDAIDPLADDYEVDVFYEQGEQRAIVKFVEVDANNPDTVITPGVAEDLVEIGKTGDNFATLNTAAVKAAIKKLEDKGYTLVSDGFENPGTGVSNTTFDNDPKKDQEFVVKVKAKVVDIPSFDPTKPVSNDNPKPTPGVIPIDPSNPSGPKWTEDLIKAVKVQEEVTRTIKYVYEDGTEVPADKLADVADKKVKTLKFTRPGKINVVTGEITYGDWSADQTFDAVTSPIIENYIAAVAGVTPTTANVPAKTVTATDKDFEEVVVYKKAKPVTITPDAKVPDPEDPNTPADNPIQPNKPIDPNNPEGPKWTKELIDKLRAAREETVTRTITYKYSTETSELKAEDAAKAGQTAADTVTNSVTFKRPVTIDPVTKEFTYGDWVADNNDTTLEGKADLPVVAGYVATGDVEGSKKDVTDVKATDKDITENVVYKTVGKYVPVIPDGITPPANTNVDPKPYNNDPQDGSKVKDPDPTNPVVPGTTTPIVPQIPGTTPVGPDGKPLKPVDSNDLSKGYVPPTPTDPTKDTSIIYVKDGSQVAVVHFVDEKGNSVNESVVETGDTGKEISKSNVDKVKAALEAKGYEVVAPTDALYTTDKEGFYKEADRKFDAVSDKATGATDEKVPSQQYYVIVKAKELPVVPTKPVDKNDKPVDPTDPTTPNKPRDPETTVTPKPTDPVPNDPKGRTYGELGLVEQVTRTIDYVYDNGTKVEEDKLGTAKDERTKTLTFTRNAKINAVTGEVTYLDANGNATTKEAAPWTPATTDTFNTVNSPVIDTYVLLDSNQKTITGETVVATDKDIAHKVVYKKAGSIKPQIPAGVNPLTPATDTPYPNNPQDPSGVLKPDPPKPTDPTQPNGPTTPVIPEVPGYTPYGPNGKPLEKDPNGGYKVPDLPTDPTQDTPIVYVKNGSQLAITKFVDVDGNGLAPSVVDSGDEGTNFTKDGDVTATINAILARGYEKVENKNNEKPYPTEATDKVFDKDSATNQEFTVTFKAKELPVVPTKPVNPNNEPVDPTDPTNPNKPRDPETSVTPKPEDKVPNDPKGRTYGELGLVEEVTRTINYVKNDGSKAADTVKETLTFTRKAKINAVTGEVTYLDNDGNATTKEAAPWTPVNGDKFAEKVSPSVTNYTPTVEKVAEKTGVTATDEDIVETVVYNPSTTNVDPNPVTPGENPDPNKVVENDPKKRTLKELGLIEEVTHTVHYKLEDGSDAGIADNVQKVTFTRTANIDSVTGAILEYGKWTPETKEFTAVTTPAKDGYIASAKTSTANANVGATDKDTEETIIYRKLGSYVPVVPAGVTPPADFDKTPKPYPNATPEDPTKPGTPTTTTTIPEIPGTTPVGPDGTPLTKNPNGGYDLPPVPKDPTQNTTITYVKDGSQVAVVHFIEVNSETDKTEKGAVAKSIVDTGDTGKAFTKGQSVTDTINALKAKGYTVVENGYPENGTFDADATTNQEYKVLVTVKEIPVSPDNETPTPNTPINPQNPDGPKWTPELIKELENGLQEDVKRTIKYIYSDGTEVPADKLTDVADKKEKTLTFKRSATINPVTGKITFGNWTPDKQSFEEVTSPAIDGYIVDRATVPAKEVTETAGDITEVVVYKKLGSYVPVVPEGVTVPPGTDTTPKVYPKDPTDPTRPGTPTTVIPHIPGVTPLNPSTGKPLEPVTPGRPEDGYKVPPVPTDPTQDTNIVYAKDGSQVAIVHFVDEDGNAVHTSFAEAGDVGSKFTKAGEVAKIVTELEKSGYSVVPNKAGQAEYPGKDGEFDSVDDKGENGVSQVYYVTVAKPVPVTPTDPKNPNEDPKNPNPGDPIDPNKPDGPKWTEDALNKLNNIKTVTRTITYVKAGTDEEVSSTEAPKVTDKVNFKRTAIVNPKDGSLVGYDTNGDGKADVPATDTDSGWTAVNNDTTFDKVTSPVVKGYVLKNTAQKEVAETTGLTPKSDNETIKVEYVPVGTWTPKVPEGETPINPIPYPNDPKDPGKVVDPNDPINPNDPNKPSVPVIPHIPGTTPKDPNGNPLKPVDPTDPSKGYVPPTPKTPTENTEIKYEKDTQKAIVKYVVEGTTKVLHKEELTGDSGTTINYTTANKLADLKVLGYELVTDGFTTATDKNFDKDTKVDQNFVVTVKPKVVDVPPFDPTNPNDPNTPKPGQPIDPENPNGPKWTEELIKSLDTTKHVNRTISYVKEDGSKVEYLDKDGNKSTADVTDKVTFTRELKVNVVTGKIVDPNVAWTSKDTTFDAVKSPVAPGYVLKDATQKVVAETTGLTENSKDETIKVVYVPVGTWVPNVPKGETPIDPIPYPNDPKDPGKVVDPNDPTKPNDPNKPSVPVIPHIPGTTPKDPNGNPLKPVDPEDPTKGYVPPTPTTPTENTEINYEKDTQKAVTKFVDPSGNPIPGVTNIEETGKSGEPLTKATEVTTEIAKLIAKGYDLVSNNYGKDNNGNFDKDSGKDQEYTVVLIPHVEPIKPFDPTNPDDPNTPKPGQPIDPNNPNGPKWTEELINKLETTKHVTRKITYVEDGTDKEVADKATDKVTFTREAKINVVTGTIEYGKWTPVNNDTTFDKVTSPVVPGYVLKDPSQKEVDETTGLTENSKDETIKVVYVPVGKLVPKVPEGVTPPTPTPYDNDPQDPGKVVPPSPTKPTDPQDPNSPKVPVIPYIPGTTPKVPQDPTKPVDPNTNPLVPLKPVDPKDPSKGYEVPPVPTDPGTDTPIVYENDKQKAITNFVDNNGKVVSDPVVDQGDSGSKFTKSGDVESKIKELVKKGYVVTSNDYPSADTDRVFDNDKDKDQIFNVKVTPLIVPTDPNSPDQPQVPTDPTKPVGPNNPLKPVTPSTPEPGKPVFPEDPNSPVWPETVKDMVTETTATRTITYVDRNGKEVAATHTETIKFKRTAKVNLVTGDITYGEWIVVGNDTILDGNKLPKVDGYIARGGDIESSQKDIKATAGVNITERVVYDKLGSWIPKLPEGQTQVPPTPYPNDPTDPTKPGTDRPRVPYVPGFIPVDPNGNPLKPVDPNDPTKGYEVPVVPADPTQDTPIKYIPVPKPNNGGGNNGGGGGNTPTPQPQPNPTPQPEPSPAPNPVPVTPETPEQPVVPVAPEQPAEPATPQYMDGQRELPNTGTEAHSSLAALGLLGALSGFGLIARKKREDEE
ncbi:mucin-binding protein [Streptococcus pseudopneumoniae]|nr:YSIRK-type signal peptide-containing protein [Streptococcus pseudopneumoniae]